MQEQDFIPKAYKNDVGSGRVSYEAPSNIALVKYWGKHGNQLPKNSSISFTLSNCKTTTTVSYSKKMTPDFEFEVFLDQKRERGFEPKIKTFFERVEAYLPFLRDYFFRIETNNSFPHSSGIASSASGMSALAMCLMGIEKGLLAVQDIDDAYCLQKASFLARLGSGSASRSIEGPIVVWGEHDKIKGSSMLFGVKYEKEVHDNFKNYRDSILLVDKGEKQVSSTVGHDLMHSNPYADLRFETANKNLNTLVGIFENGDLNAFIDVVEREALQLHAMMMVSQPYFILMKPNTLEIINKIWNHRQATGSKVCFTLDAGANVHVLYPDAEKEETVLFIENELAQFCKNGEYIHDRLGLGARLLS